MKSIPANSPPVEGGQSAGRSGRRTWILAPGFVLIGLGLAGLWVKSTGYVPRWLLPKPVNLMLSENARDFLRQLSVPVEIRFYSILPPGNAPETLRDFSGRVDRLLSEFQAANEIQIQVTRNNTSAAVNTAEADGLPAFNLDKGDACFLGIAVVAGVRKELLSRLQPEWEPALPYDLLRAIQQVAVPPPTAPLAREVAAPSPVILNSIHRLIPNIQTVSVEQADQIFHVEFMSEYSQASAEAEAQVNAAQQQVEAAQRSGSADDLAAAQKKLLQVQLAQGEKIKQLAADLQNRLAVFQQMKAAATPAK